jgi:AAA+ ATPase superfamily predicted ATPase
MVKDFDIIKLKQPAFTVIFGRKSSGKTCLLKDIINSLVSPSEHWTIIDQYNNFANFALLEAPYFKFDVIASFDNDVLAKSCEHSKYILFDDPPFYDDHFTSSSSIKTLIKEGKNKNISAIMTFNVPVSCKIIEKNADYIFILKDTSEFFFKLLSERYFSTFKKKCKDFDVGVLKCAMNELEDFECLVIDTSVKSTKIEDYLFRYKAVFIC